MAARIIVACGSGVATSQMVASKVTQLLKDRGIDADVEAVNMKSLGESLEGADAYISVVKTNEHYDVPVFNGVAFLTGEGQNEELDRLIAAIR